MILDEKLVQEIRKVQTSLNSEGKLPSKAQLDVLYETFRQRFGPDRLKTLDGEALLDTIHDHSNRDSLVYWLEFKNDDELPAIFGSIAGGSALKFGIYRRRETGSWEGRWGQALLFDILNRSAFACAYSDEFGHLIRRKLAGHCD